MPVDSSDKAAPSTSRAPTARPGLALLIALAALGPLAMNMPLPAMPEMARSLAVPYGTIQLVVTLFLTSIAVFQLILGPLSDRLGRRPVMIVGLGLYVLGCLICALAPSAPLLIAGRMVQAAGGCAGLVLGRAIVRDLYGRERAASMIGYITMAMVVAPMVAPSIGGYLVERTGWRPPFLLLAVVGLVVAAVALRFLAETNHARAGGSAFSFFSAAPVLLRMPAFQCHCLVTAFTSGMFFAFIGGAPFIVVELMGRPPSEYGNWFVVSALGYMMGNFLSGRFTERFGPARMILAGALLGLVGLAGLWLLAGLERPAAIFLPMCVVALCNGLVLPSATSSAVSVRPDLAGTASGLCGSFQLGTGAVMSFLVGTLVHESSLPMIATMTGCGIVALIGVMLTPREAALAAQ